MSLASILVIGQGSMGWNIEVRDELVDEQQARIIDNQSSKMIMMRVTLPLLPCVS
jgi:hypothetical protein